MPLTIELPPELESRLRKEAAKRDVSAAEYAQVLLKNILSTFRPAGGSHLPLYLTGTTEEIVRGFHELIQSFEDVAAPPIPEEALRRENMYEDRI